VLLLLVVSAVTSVVFISNQIEYWAIIQNFKSELNSFHILTSHH